MDAACARRLAGAWIAACRDAKPIKKTKGGFYVPHDYFELEYDAAGGALVARHVPLRMECLEPTSWLGRQQQVVLRKIKRPRGTTLEVAQLRARPKARYWVLRRDFTDPAMTEKAFVAAVAAHRKLGE